MSPESEYFWVVLCKNHKFHERQNLFFGHKIPLGETDAFQHPPDLNAGLKVRCDDCGQEYTYQSKDLLRTELELPESFNPTLFFSSYGSCRTERGRPCPDRSSENSVERGTSPSVASLETSDRKRSLLQNEMVHIRRRAVQ